jgi:hypothetical protein
MNESNLRWIEWTNLLTVAMILSESAVQVTGLGSWLSPRRND